MKALVLALLLIWPWGAVAECRQALAIGLDVSGSVDDREYRLQLGGLANALDHPDVRAALMQMPGRPVWLAVYDWTAPEDQRLLLDWTALDGAATLDGVVATLRAVGRVRRDPQTAVGASMEYGARLLTLRGDCPRLTLDLTGDGMSNTGPLPRDVRLPPQITVNALVVNEAGEGTMLTDWFRSQVIRGPGAFAEPAYGFEDFERAMVRKLLKELDGMRIGEASGLMGTKG